jgi:eukaryotic-like serine/threonine-protein kinase
LAQCELAEQVLGPPPDAPGPEWLAPWLEVQSLRMGVLYWLSDTDEFARLVEQVRPVIEAHGSAEQRANFLFDLVHLALRRDRYLASDETVELARAAEEARGTADFYSNFLVGFTLLWHGDLDQATALIEKALREAERRGVATTRSRALTYLMVAGRKRGDVDGVREAIARVIEAARETSLPEYEAMAIANRAWVAWRTGHDEEAAADALAALDMWHKAPVRYFFDWMASFPLLAMALAEGQVQQAVDHARGAISEQQQLLREPLRTHLEDAVHAWDEGRAAESEGLLRLAIDAAGRLGYL